MFRVCQATALALSGIHDEAGRRNLHGLTRPSLRTRRLPGAPGITDGRALRLQRLAFSNVIMSVRVTVTHLVVTGGPPPAMCQAA